MIHINERALRIVHQMIEDQAALGIQAETLSNGATVIDAGVNAKGSLEAGRLFSEACLGGLGQVRFCQLDFGGFSMPGVSVHVSHPVVACIASQYAGWSIKVTQTDNTPYTAMGSGPARSLYRQESLFDNLAYHDRASVSVLALESRKLPNAEVAVWIAKQCGILPENVYLLVAPTASIVGSVQIASRVVETGVHKMNELGFDIYAVLSGFGTCPLAPIASDDIKAIGRTNDMVLYGGQVWYTIQAEPRAIEAIIHKLSSCASKDYGTPFYDLFQKVGGDFYKIDPSLFSPAKVVVNELTSGRSFSAGEVNLNLLKQVFMG